MDAEQERRTKPRRRTIQGAKIVYGDYRYVIDCVVRDISSEGARIRVPSVAEVPDSFLLFDGRSGDLTPAVTRWRSEGEIGLQFTGEPVNVHSTQDARLARFRYM